MEARLIALKLVLDALDIPNTIDTIDDRKRVQKAVYLGQLAGVKLGYRFGWYLKGPYSPDLTKDYYSLEEAIIMGDRDYERTILQQPLLDRLKQVRPLLDVPENVSLLQEDWLELVSSLHYLRKISNQSKEEANRTLREQKPNLVKYVSQAEEKLKEVKLLN